MSISSNGMTIYRLNPDEIERFLTAKYGGKIAAVDPVKMAKQNQRIAKFNAKCKEPDF